jgi:hypothetical protein
MCCTGELTLEEMDREPAIDILKGQYKGSEMKKNGMLMSMIIALSYLSLCLISGENIESLPRFEQPLLITSAGQSADVQIAGVLAKRAGLMSNLSKYATYQELGNKKTLALVIGVSMKGLGAAGLDLSQEKTRVMELIAEAQKKNIPILCLHLGGEARRGELSDQTIQDFLPYAQMVIVVKSGNKDGLFTKICSDKNIPLLEVDRTADVQEPLKSMFAPKG